MALMSHPWRSIAVPSIMGTKIIGTHVIQTITEIPFFVGERHLNRSRNSVLLRGAGKLSFFDCIKCVKVAKPNRMLKSTYLRGIFWLSLAEFFDTKYIGTYLLSTCYTLVHTSADVLSTQFKLKFFVFLTAWVKPTSRVSNSNLDFLTELVSRGLDNTC